MVSVQYISLAASVLLQTGLITMTEESTSYAGASTTQCAHEVRDMIKKMAMQHDVPMPRMKDQILEGTDDDTTQPLVRETKLWLQPAIGMMRQAVEHIITQALQLHITEKTRKISAIVLPPKEHFEQLVLEFDAQNCFTNFYFKRDIDTI